MKRRQGDEAARVSDQDEWALEWINMNRLQSIAEAFDDDASGFVTIGEVNQFTSSRPKEWRHVLHPLVEVLPTDYARIVYHTGLHSGP